MLTEILVGLLVGLLLACGLYIHRKQQAFLRRNVKHIKPIFFFGNSFEAMLGRKNPTEILDAEYQQFKSEDIFGHMDLWNPQFILKSPELIESVLVRDFASFHDRVAPSSGKKVETAQEANLFMMGGNTWRAIRFKFTPLFTSGKLRFMYDSMSDCGKNLRQLLDLQTEAGGGKEVEMSELMCLFTMDVIGSTVFGVEPNLLQNPNSEFREKGKKLFDLTFLDNIRLLFLFFLPKVAKFFGIKGFMKDDVSDYYYSIIERTMNHRQEAGFTRNDFIQMLLALREKGKIEMQITDPADNYLLMDKPSETFELELTDNILIGGALTFLFAGFHATAMTLTYALFELAQKPQVLDRLRQEIKASVKGDLPTYDELKSMTYCEKVIKEALRKHPTAPVLGRYCNKEYTLPNGFQLHPGDIVGIPVQSIHMDPIHWPDPEEFNPDRFDVEPRPGTYLPFGEGPRICIAMRFAMMEMKFAIALLSAHYDFTLKSTKTPRMKPRAFLKTPQGGITFSVKKITT